MKCFSIGLVVSLSLAIAFAAPSSEDTESVAVRECNVTYPVQQNPRYTIAFSVAQGGKLLDLNQNEKCFLNCLLGKVHFLDENSNIQAARFVNYTLKKVPDLVKYSNVFIANIYQLNRLYRTIPDKCQKAFVYYHEIASQIVALGFADGLSALSDAQQKIYNAIENGKEVDANVGKEIKNTLDFLNELLKQALPSV